MSGAHDHSTRSASHAYDYSRWDGTQAGFDLDADSVLAELNDDLLYHGDVNAALRRMLQDGFRDRNQERIAGIRELLERLRQQRRERLERYDLGGAYDDIARELREVVDEERAALDELEQGATDSGDERRQQVTGEAVEERRMALDLLPPDLAGQVRSLEQYDFVSSDARERFEELMDRLRQQILQSYFNQMAGAMSDVSPEQMQRMKDMLAELNHMLEQRARGEEPDFDGFMERFGDFFPGNPQTLDELLEQMAQQMAAMQRLLNSMTPEQRAQLQGLAEQLLEDLDLRWQVDQLSSQLQQLFPQAGWNRSYEFEGVDPLGLGEAASLMNELGDIDQLEQLLRSASNPGALAEVDVDRARELLGDESAASLERLSEVARMLEEAGYIEQREGRFELTPRGLQRVGQHALAELFRKLAQDHAGRHTLERAGLGHERADQTKPYEWGDPFNLHIERTLRNALARQGPGTPVRLAPADFEIEQTETLTRASTVLLLDLSLSMPMRGNYLAAKKVAIALHALMRLQFPRDYLGLVAFSEVARELKAEELPEVAWDYVYGTNMQHALLLARRMLAKQSGTKQVIMITDGEPTAHLEPGSDIPFFHYPPVQATVDATLREVLRCTREGIRINTFMLDETPYLVEFIEKVTKLNGGRAFFTSPDTLGEYVLVDFVEHRRALVGRRDI